MVVLNKIYTRTGDDGTTALGSGARRKKYDLRIRAYGTLDEVNAVIGIVRLHAGGDQALDAMLAHIQNDLFDVEADLCLSEKGPAGARMTVTDTQVEWLERQIDELNADLSPLRSFI
ncbi:MAG TPA: ATP:cob(I)alamin adenosyltransferase, partial [Xanthobacteraceae bacterium]|nr:ATP:cob(I)alamin adenosyltransferase [Xanthobacteraceae bacterium]